MLRGRTLCALLRLDGADRGRLRALGSFDLGFGEGCEMRVGAGDDDLGAIAVFDSFDLALADQPIEVRAGDVVALSGLGNVLKDRSRHDRPLLLRRTFMG
jgi:hypothetical protein